MGEVVPIPVREPGRCTATTRSGARCRNRAVDVSGMCRVHGGGVVEPSPGPSTDEIDELLAFLRRRVTGEYEVDEFGFDPELTETILAPLARLFHKRYFRVEWRGLEHIPRDGAALLVSNHAGTIPMDAVIMKFGLLDQVERHVRLLAADLVFRLPFVGELARKSGNTLACDEDALRLLERGELLGVFPEGYKGVGKLFKDRYKLQRFGRGGFIELGLRAGAPIVPVAIVGSEEIYPLISHARPLARMLKLPYFPVTPLFPWLGPLGMLPLPTKWTIEFRPPIATDGLGEEAWQDSLLVFEMTDRVRDEIQQTLNRNLGARRSLFL
ncbi:MAG TPA: lysophospholipid acyltransferase family protein [Actinomycetota bacterium]|nr:lysophospholipid acyltransferase family protein [Actinomycetota bacterium]